MTTISSPHLTVGALLSFSFHAPSIPHPIIIHSIALSINQTFTLSSLLQPSKPPVKLAPQTLPIFTLDAQHLPASSSNVPVKRFLAKLAPGQEPYSLTHRSRLPCDGVLRSTITRPVDETGEPTTLLPFITSHELAIAVKFQVEGEKPKVLWIRRPIEIASVSILVLA